MPIIIAPDNIGDSEPDQDPISASTKATSISPSATNRGDDGEDDMSPMPGQGDSTTGKMKGGMNGTTQSLRLLGAGQPYGK